MEFKELKKQKNSDLHRILAEQRDKLRELRFKDANKQLKNVRDIRETKHTIAQVLTLLNKGAETEKELEIGEKEDKKVDKK